MSDLISRQDAIYALTEANLKSHMDSVEGGQENRSAIRIIMELPSAERKRGEWILCSERLPDEEGEYLLLYDSYFMNGKFAERRMKVEDFIIKPTKHFYREKGSSARYIAWMPLPEPWKGEEDER